MNPLKSLLPLVLIAVTGTNSVLAEDGSRQIMKDVHDDLLTKFTPMTYGKNEQKLRNISGEKPFSGDCVDYYVAAHNQLVKHGLVPYARFLHRKSDAEGHLVACVDIGKRSLCLDPNNNRVTTAGKLHREYRTVRIERG